MDNLKVEKFIIAKKPVVVISVEAWHVIEDKLEEREILLSRTLAKNIKKARDEKERGKVVSFEKIAG